MDGGLMRFNHQWEYGDDMNDIYLLPGMKPSILWAYDAHKMGMTVG